MARNEEKANAVLNRFWEAKQEEKRKGRQKKRPFLASECNDLADADRWRQQILREVGRKVCEIQNPGLGEHRLRDLNDEINKLIREKGHWEERILELGGPNYKKISPQVTDAEGAAVEAASGKGPGYRYFGAAKELPGVKELFETPGIPNKKKNRYELFKRIDMDYYGFRDEEDGVLARLEAKAEAAALDKAEREWEEARKEREQARKGVASEAEAAQAGKGGEGERAEEEETDVVLVREGLAADGRGAAAARGGGEALGGSERKEQRKERQFVAHVPLPDEKEIERLVLQKKKADLLSKYASEALVQEEQEAKQLLNIQS